MSDVKIFMTSSKLIQFFFYRNKSCLGNHAFWLQMLRMAPIYDNYILNTLFWQSHSAATFNTKRTTEVKFHSFWCPAILQRWRKFASLIWNDQINNLQLFLKPELLLKVFKTRSSTWLLILIFIDFQYNFRKNNWYWMNENGNIYIIYILSYCQLRFGVFKVIIIIIIRPKSQ